MRASRSNKIKYQVSNGMISYELTFGVNQSGIVPADVVEKGISEVQLYVEMQLRIQEEKLNELNTIRQRVVGQRITVNQGSMQLVGHITQASERVLEVALDSPMTGKLYVNYNFASALARRRVFDGATLTASAYVTAQELLIKIYKEKLEQQDNKSLYKLVNELKSMS